MNYRAIKILIPLVLLIGIVIAVLGYVLSKTSTNTEDDLTYQQFLDSYSIDQMANADDYIITPSEEVYDTAAISQLLDNSTKAKEFEHYEQFAASCIDAIPVSSIYSYPGVAYEDLVVSQFRNAPKDATQYNTLLTLEGTTTAEETRVSDSDYYELHFNLDADAGTCALVNMRTDRRYIVASVERSAIALALLNPIVADRLQQKNHKSIRVVKSLKGKQYEEDITGLIVGITQYSKPESGCFAPSGRDSGFSVNVDVVTGKVTVGDYVTHNWPCTPRYSSEL